MILTLIVAILVLGFAWWLIGYLNLPPIAQKAFVIVAALLGFIWLLGILGYGPGLKV